MLKYLKTLLPSSRMKDKAFKRSGRDPLYTEPIASSVHVHGNPFPYGINSINPVNIQYPDSESLFFHFQ